VYEFFKELKRRWQATARDTRQEVETARTPLPIKPDPPEPRVKVYAPRMADTVRCFVQTVQADPSRFKIVVPRRMGGLHKGFEGGQLTDRKLGRTWNFTYYPKTYYREATYIEIQGVPISEAEGAYLIANLGPIFEARAWRRAAILAKRENRKVLAVRTELHTLYCKGETCVASCN